MTFHAVVKIFRTPPIRRAEGEATWTMARREPIDSQGSAPKRELDPWEDGQCEHNLCQSPHVHLHKSHMHLHNRVSTDKGTAGSRALLCGRFRWLDPAINWRNSKIQFQSQFPFAFSICTSICPRPCIFNVQFKAFFPFLVRQTKT